MGAVFASALEQRGSTGDFARYIQILSRHLWLVIAGAVLGGLASWYVAASAIPVYTASAMLLIKEGENPTSLAGSDIGRSRALASTYQRLITTRPILEDAARRLGDDVTAGELAAKVRVGVISGTQLLSLTATDLDPVMAADMANTVVETFITRTLETQLADAARLGETAAARGVADASAIITSQLGSLSPLVVAELAVPDWSPTGAPARVKIALGAVLGLLSGGLAAFVIDYFRDVITSKDKFEDRFDLAVVGVVPFVRRPEVGADGEKPHPSFLEAWRFVRTNLQLMPAEKKIKTLMVCSAEGQVGKSTVICHLARSIAAGGKSVLVIDADLRKPELEQRLLGERQVPGVSNFIADDVLTVNELARKTKIPGVRLIASGAIPPSPAELLSSPRLVTLLAEASALADVVLIDSPPALVVADATIIAPFVDGVLVVVDTTKTKSRPFGRALEAFAQIDARVIGVVLNKYKAGRFESGYGYGYGYGYGNGHVHGSNGTSDANGRSSKGARLHLGNLGKRVGEYVFRRHKDPV